MAKQEKEKRQIIVHKTHHRKIKHEAAQTPSKSGK